MQIAEAQLRPRWIVVTHWGQMYLICVPVLEKRKLLAHLLFWPLCYVNCCCRMCNHSCEERQACTAIRASQKGFRIVFRKITSQLLSVSQNSAGQTHLNSGLQFQNTFLASFNSIWQWSFSLQTAWLLSSWKRVSLTLQICDSHELQKTWQSL